MSTGGFGGSSGATAYGQGTSRVSTINSGLFSGRTVGGGTRNNVYGSRSYGSGYPGVSGFLVGGRGFPFYFWPVAWGGAAGVGTGAYLHNREYGEPNNSSRPGGPISEIAFASPSTNSTFRILADNSTATSLLDSIYSACNGKFKDGFPTTSNTSAPSPFNDTASNATSPGNAVQYYRASSVVLTLDGYNDTAALGENVTNAADPIYHVPLPNTTDTTLPNCLNDTIGAAVPLANGAEAPLADGAHALRIAGLGTMSLLWVISHLLSSLV